MSKEVFISMPVNDLAKSMAFYQAIGLKNNPQFTDETAAGMVWSDAVKLMLITHSKWQSLTQRPIPPSTSSEMAINISCDSRAAVDDLILTAAAYGGQVDMNPAQDLGFMYSRDFTDPDGHAWGAFWMDMPAALDDAS